MNIRRPLLAVIYGLVISCGPSGGPSRPDAVILGGWAVHAILKQCSRDTPIQGEGSWQPSWLDIAPMEALLPKALAADRRATKIKGLMPPTGWLRQYVGIIRNHHRFIYGNYFPNDPNFDKGWRQHPIMVCDGGGAFFGVEYDVSAHRLDHLAFNGEA